MAGLLWVIRLVIHENAQHASETPSSLSSLGQGVQLTGALLTPFLGTPALNSVLYLPRFPSVLLFHKVSWVTWQCVSLLTEGWPAAGLLVGKEITNTTPQGFLDQGVDAN